MRLGLVDALGLIVLILINLFFDRIFKAFSTFRNIEGKTVYDSLNFGIYIYDEYYLAYKLDTAVLSRLIAVSYDNTMFFVLIATLIDNNLLVPVT